MKKTILLIAFGALVHSSTYSAVEVGQDAPAFKVTKTLSGNPVTLDDLKKRGRPIILEWFNFDCPYVKKHYVSKEGKPGNIPQLQQQFDSDAIWVTVNSAYPEHTTYYDVEKTKEMFTKKNWKATPDYYLFDESGELTRSYEAKTTPHLYIISPEGKVVFEGGVDSLRSTDPDDIRDDENKHYFKQAMEELKSGKTISNPNPPEYGCSVKVREA